MPDGTLRRWATWIVFVALIASAVWMAELDRLIEQFLTPTGQSFSMSLAEGLPPRADAWAAFYSSDPSPLPLIRVHAVVDIFFSLAYCWFGWRLFSAASKDSTGHLPVIRYFWVAVLATEVLESIFILASAPGGAIVTISWIKWAGLLVCLGTLVLVPTVRHYLVDWLGRWARAFFVHRVSLVIVVTLGVFALLPKGELFDQFPDAVRVWSDSDAGWWRIPLALVAFLAISVSVFVFGRRSTARVVAGGVRPPGTIPGYTIWFLVPSAFVVVAIGIVAFAGSLWALWAGIAFVVVAVVVGIISVRKKTTSDDTGAESRRRRRAFAMFGVACGAFAASIVLFAADSSALLPIDAAKLFVFVLLAAGVPAVSLWLTDLPTKPPAAVDVDAVSVAGRILAALAIAVLGLGMVRAFVAPLALADDAVWWWFIIPGILVALTAYPVADLVSHRLDVASAAPLASGTGTPMQKLAERLDVSPESAGSSPRRLRYISIGGGLVIIGGFLLLPLVVAHGVDVVSTVALVLLGWLLVISNADAEAKDRPPLPVWGRIGLRSDPVLAVLLIGPILLSQLNADPGLHAIERASDAIDQPTRLSLDDAFSDWLTATADRPECQTTVDGSTIRPLVLIAAEGGGIRAAAWTARVVDELAAAGGCAADSVFISSGASGGSIGLAIAQGTAVGGSFAETRALAHSPALPAATSGLLVGDVVAGATGVRIPTDGYQPDGGLVWQDRAAHLQWEWRNTVDALSKPYDHDVSPATGWVVLNTAAVGYDCRGVISQLDLDIPRPVVSSDDGPQIPNCAGDGPGIANTIDIEDLYGDCLLAMDWATAGLTSARFPVITPAGRTSAPGVDGCAKLPDLQLTDGGVAENSGLGSLADLAPELTALIREENAKSGSTPIMPILVYASNEPGKDVTSGQAPFRSEIGVALSQGDLQASQNSAKAWLQRLADTLEDSCAAAPDPALQPAADAAPEAVASYAAAVAAFASCDAARSASRGTGDGVFVVAPQSQPAIAVPLGWVLSDLSLDRIDREIHKQCSNATSWPTGYLGLREARALLGGGACTPVTP